MSFGTALMAVNTGLNLLGGLSASKQANKSAKQSQQLINRQIDALDRQEGIYDAGADAMQQALATLLQSYDGRGQYDPQAVDDLAALLSQEYEEGDAQTRQDVLDEGLAQQGRTNRQLLAELALAQQFAPTAGGLGKRADINTMMDPNRYTAAVEALSGKFKKELDASSERNLEEAMGKMIADSQRKLGGAVTGQSFVQARQMADAMQEQEAKNTLSAINMAMEQMSGLQTMAGRDQAGNINAQRADLAGLDYDRAIADMAFRQAIDAASAGQKLYQQAQGGERLDTLGAFGYLQALDQQNVNRDFGFFQDALATVGKEQTLANNTIAQLQNLATAPYSYRVQGPAGILSGAGNASQAAGNMLNTYATQAGGAFQAAGASADKLLKESGLGDQPFFSSSAPVNTASTMSTGGNIDLASPQFNYMKTSNTAGWT